MNKQTINTIQLAFVAVAGQAQVRCRFEAMLLCDRSEVMCRWEVIGLQGESAVGTGSGTLCCEKAAGVSLISSARC